MKFIHTADIHLDSPLSGLITYQNIPVEKVRRATRDAFANLINTAIEEHIDFLIIAGDLYDGTWRDYNTGLYFSQEMGRLYKAEIPVYLLWGNHDAESEMTKKLVLPPNVHLFNTHHVTTYRLEKHHVALHGRSFKHAATTENLVLTYPNPVPNWLNIGVLHTALEGDSTHAHYAPCSPLELSMKGYDYWALGHIHEYRIIQKEPSWIIFPGNLQGRHIRETGEKGAVLVTTEEQEIRSVERILVDVLRWHQLDIDISGILTLKDVVKQIGLRLEQLFQDNEDGRIKIVRVILHGKTVVHGELFGAATHFRTEVLAQAAIIDSENLFIEKVQVKTEPLVDAKTLQARSDAIADLSQLLEQASDDPALLNQLETTLQKFISKMPHDLINVIPESKSIQQGNLAPLVRSTIPELIAYLTHPDSE